MYFLTSFQSGAVSVIASSVIAERAVRLIAMSVIATLV